MPHCSLLQPSVVMPLPSLLLRLAALMPLSAPFPPPMYAELRAFVITLGRAGEDGKTFILRDTESTFAGFAGADYNLQDALTSATDIVKSKRTVDGVDFYDYDIDSPGRWMEEGLHAGGEAAHTDSVDPAAAEVEQAASPPHARASPSHARASPPRARASPLHFIILHRRG